MRKKLCHEEDSGKNDRTGELSHSCLVHTEDQHLNKDCQVVSIKVDSGDSYPAATATNQEQELQKSQISLREANEHGLGNEMMKIAECQPQLDPPNNVAGMIFPLGLNIEISNLNILFSNCEVFIDLYISSKLHHAFFFHFI